MKYRPNLWSTVDRIQTSPDDRKRLIYIPDSEAVSRAKLFEVHVKKDRELKNAFRL